MVNKLSTAKMEELQARFFKLYPGKKELYFTEDGNCFLEKSPAKDHANKSKIKMITVSKKDHDAEVKKAKVDAAKKKAEELAKKKKEEAEDWLVAIPSLENVPYKDQVDKLQDILGDLKGLKDKKAETVQTELEKIRKDLLSKIDKK